MDASTIIPVTDIEEKLGHREVKYLVQSCTATELESELSIPRFSDLSNMTAALMIYVSFCPLCMSLSFSLNSKLLKAWMKSWSPLYQCPVERTLNNYLLFD